MKNLIIASLTSTLILASITPAAFAGERVTRHHHAVISEHVRNANASVPLFEAPGEASAAHSYYDGALGAGMVGH